MNRAIKIAERLVLGLVVLIAAAALFALAVPSTVLNTGTLKYAVRRFGGDYRPSASDLSLRVSSQGLLTKRVVFAARDLCVDEVHGAATGCLPALEVEAVVRLGVRPLVSVRRLERLFVRAGELRWDATKAPAAPEEPAGEKPAELVPAWAARMTLGVIDVKAPKAILVSSAGVTTAGLTAAFRSGSTEPLTAEAYAILQGTGPAPGSRWDAELRLDSDLFREGRLTALDATLRARGGDGLTASAVAKLEPREGGVRGTLDVLASSAKGRLRLAALEGCRIEASRGKHGAFERADADCRVSLQPAPFGLGQGPKPKALTGTASLHGDKAELRLGPVKGYGGFALSVDAGLGSKRAATAKASITSFAEVVRLLDGTEFAIPAPLNALDGSVEAEARLAREGRRQVLEFGARTNLASAKQALVVSVKGGASSRPAPKLEADVRLERVVLELPYLELKAAPSPFVDTRIKTGGPERAPARAGADYDAAVRTSTPIILTTNLLKSPVPISLDLRARPEGLSGTIRVEGFDMEVFRQKARVEHVTLTPRPKGAATGLDGKLVYKREGATVNILLLGSTAKPAVVFESDPPMSQDEIVALVLYGKRPGELDSDQKASAGNAAAAMTSGAFGLASLYLFASTPVESVGYDAATATYQVKFKLPGGATLSVGSNLQESRTLGLRKRLARHWELQTEASADARERNAITTFLQWFERY